MVVLVSWSAGLRCLASIQICVSGDRADEIFIVITVLSDRVNDCVKYFKFMGVDSETGFDFNFGCFLCMLFSSYGSIGYFSRK